MIPALSYFASNMGKLYQIFKQLYNYFLKENTCSKMLYKIGVLKRFTKHTPKRLYQSLDFNKGSCRPGAWEFVTNETSLQVFSYKFCQVSKNKFFIKHLRWLLLSRETSHRKRQHLRQQSTEVYC